MKRPITYRELIQELLEQELDQPVRFIWNGESDHMVTFNDCSIQISNDKKHYILLEKKEVS